MTNLSSRIITDFEDITFKSGKRFLWSPGDKTVYFEQGRVNTHDGQVTLLHEISHALLEHTSFKSDLELLQMEVGAWTKARELADKYEIELDDEYIDDCLESYREWLYKRSMCVECGTNSLQDETGHYSCHVCGQKWSVPTSQLCRIQRRKVSNKNSK